MWCLDGQMIDGCATKGDCLDELILLLLLLLSLTYARESESKGKQGK